MPPKLSLNDIEIASSDLPDIFADFFKNKVNNIVQEQVINNDVYNGVRKLYCAESHFMSIENILEAVNTLKTKNVKVTTESPK